MADKTQYEIEDGEKIKAARRNPLCNYNAQIAVKRKGKKKRVGDTSLGNEPQLGLLGIHDHTEIKYKEDVGNFDYSKLINQEDLMGHEFQRQAYGSSASLEQKLAWLQKIQLE